LDFLTQWVVFIFISREKYSPINHFPSDSRRPYKWIVKTTFKAVLVQDNGKYPEGPVLIPLAGEGSDNFREVKNLLTLTEF